MRTQPAAAKDSYRTIRLAYSPGRISNNQVGQPGRSASCSEQATCRGGMPCRQKADRRPPSTIKHAQQHEIYSSRCAHGLSAVYHRHISITICKEILTSTVHIDLPSGGLCGFTGRPPDDNPTEPCRTLLSGSTLSTSCASTFVGR